MKLPKMKKAYTIAEIMVVLLILTIILAAFAPLITKRRIASYQGLDNVWNYVSVTRPMNAIYSSKKKTDDKKTGTGTLFFGLTPQTEGDITEAYTPLSKIVIRSGDEVASSQMQRQIMFRYGSGDYGTFAGTWLMDGKNILLGGKYTNKSKYVDRNTAIGYMSMNNIMDDVFNVRGATYNTALGSGALSDITIGYRNTAVGYHAGHSITTSLFGLLSSRKPSNKNTYIGAYAGEANKIGSNNTAVGYNAAAELEKGNKNTFVGANAGTGETGTTATSNVGIGYNALHKVSGNYNVAIGAHALENLTTGQFNVAIGYNACSNVTSGSYKTCIGYDSGPGHSGSTANNVIEGTTDNIERTYIGGKPYKYGGDAVLEIHNVGTENPELGVNDDGDAPKSPWHTRANQVNSNTTTVINGNLIIRGRPYFTIGGNLYNFKNNEQYKHQHYLPGSPRIRLLGYNDSSDICANDPTNYGYRDGQKEFNPSSGCTVSLYPKISDRRLKNISSRFNAGLEEINKLNIYNYTFKKDPTHELHTGVIAQELQKVFPNSVTKDAQGYLRIRWDEMFYASINAIKQLDNKIIALIKKVTHLETEITKLEKENNTLKSEVNALSARVERLKIK